MNEHTIVVDLGYGDAGKGTVVDWLCARGPAPVHAVVRFNGGAQAAHNVVTDDGRHHTFAQFGSGSFSPGVRTHLSRFMLVDPLALAVEADHLGTQGVPGILDRLTVDRDALLTTPFHRAANRAREVARGAARHGSCGIGVGETAAYALAHDDAPRAGDGRRALRRGLTLLRDRLIDELGPLDVPDIDDCLAAFGAFSDRVRIVGDEFLTGLLRTGPVVFEGAQGVLLDEWHGFHPYTTWSTTTFANAETLLAESGLPGSAIRLGVVRSYAVRHGPGPFVTEDPLLTAALPESHNRPGRWQGPVRVGHLDTVVLRYAAEVCAAQGHPVDAIAMTCLDLAERTPELRICRGYKGIEPPKPDLTHDLDRQAHLTTRLLEADPILEKPDGDWPAAIESALKIPVTLCSHGPTRSAKRRRPSEIGRPPRPQTLRSTETTTPSTAAWSPSMTS